MAQYRPLLQDCCRNVGRCSYNNESLGVVLVGWVWTRSVGLVYGQRQVILLDILLVLVWSLTICSVDGGGTSKRILILGVSRWLTLVVFFLLRLTSALIVVATLDSDVGFRWTS